MRQKPVGGGGGSWRVFVSEKTTISVDASATQGTKVKKWRSRVPHQSSFRGLSSLGAWTAGPRSLLLLFFPFLIHLVPVSTMDSCWVVMGNLPAADLRPAILCSPVEHLNHQATWHPRMGRVLVPFCPCTEQGEWGMRGRVGK